MLRVRWVAPRHAVRSLKTEVRWLEPTGQVHVVRWPSMQGGRRPPGLLPYPGDA